MVEMGRFLEASGHLRAEVGGDGEGCRNRQHDRGYGTDGSSAPLQGMPRFVSKQKEVGARPAGYGTLTLVIWPPTTSDCDSSVILCLWSLRVPDLDLDGGQG